MCRVVELSSAKSTRSVRLSRKRHCNLTACSNGPLTKPSFSRDATTRVVETKPPCSSRSRMILNSSRHSTSFKQLKQVADGGGRCPGPTSARKPTENLANFESVPTPQPCKDGSTHGPDLSPVEATKLCSRPNGNPVACHESSLLNVPGWVFDSHLLPANARGKFLLQMM